jgi:hypothetical protein
MDLAPKAIRSLKSGNHNLACLDLQREKGSIYISSLVTGFSVTCYPRLPALGNIKTKTHK